jgi:hypothetical protein
MTLPQDLAQQALDALAGLIEAATSEVNEKGAGGYMLARIHDAKEVSAALRSYVESGGGKAVLPHPACKPDTLVNGGALQMALMALRRAGKTEIAAELEATAHPAQGVGE